MRRAKAVFWWCCMHTEHPLGTAEFLASMPMDDDIVELCPQGAYTPGNRKDQVNGETGSSGQN